MAKKDTSPYKVKLTIGDASVEVEGAESGVVKIVEALSQALIPRRATVSSSPSAFPPAVAGSPPSLPSARPPDVRSFFEQKRPGSDVEAAATAAYYYKYLAAEEERRDTINSDVLQQAFRLARRPLPPEMKYTLQNARNAGYLDSAGSGEFRLNAVGFNLVEHTLGQEDRTPEGSRARGRRPARKATRKPARKATQTRRKAVHQPNLSALS